MEKRFTCRVCGDKVPYIFGTGMPDGKWVCACCGGEVAINNRRRENFNIPDDMDTVLMATRTDYFGDNAGFTRVQLIQEEKFDKYQEKYKDARMVRLTRKEVEDIAFYADRAFQAKKSWRVKYEVYQTVALRMMQEMKWKLQDDETMEALMNKLWEMNRVGAANIMEAGVKRGKPDYEVMRALLETLAANIESK